MPAPKLPREKLLAAAGALRHLPLSSGVARETMAILLEAATPDRHSLDRVEGERGENMRKTAQKMSRHTSRVLRRAAEGLRAIPDDEWRALADEAAQADEES